MLGFIKLKRKIDTIKKKINFYFYNTAYSSIICYFYSLYSLKYIFISCLLKLFQLIFFIYILTCISILIDALCKLWSMFVSTNYAIMKVIIEYNIVKDYIDVIKYMCISKNMLQYTNIFLTRLKTVEREKLIRTDSIILGAKQTYCMIGTISLT